MVSRRKGSIGRWLAELLISPTGGCRPRGLRYVAGILAGPYTDPNRREMLRGWADGTGRRDGPCPPPHSMRERSSSGNVFPFRIPRMIYAGLSHLLV